MAKSVEKNATALFIIAISAAVILCLASTSQTTAYTNPPPLTRENFCMSAITPASIKLDNGYYNVSVALTSAGETDTLLHKFLVYPQANASDMYAANKTSPDVLVYFNGTIVDPNQINYNLESGASLQANCLIPISEYAPNSMMRITVYTSQAIYVACFHLNWIA